MAPRGLALVLGLLVAFVVAEEAAPSCKEEGASADVCLLQVKSTPGQVKNAIRATRGKAPNGKGTQVKMSAAQVHKSFGHVHKILDHHKALSQGYAMEGGMHFGGNLKAHKAIRTSLTQLRERTEHFLEHMVNEADQHKVRAALLQLQAPAGELKKGLDNLEALQLKAVPGQVKNQIKAQRGRGRTGPGSQIKGAQIHKAFGHVHRLLDQHKALSKGFAMEGGTNFGGNLKAHRAVRRSLTQLRSRTEHFLEHMANEADQHKVHAALLQLQAPAGELKKGLDHLEAVLNTAKRASKEA